MNGCLYISASFSTIKIEERTKLKKRQVHDCVARQVELDRQEANAKARSASMVPSVVFPLEDARLPLDRGFTHNVGKTAINHSQKHDHFDRWYKLTIPRKSWVIYDIV